MLSLPETRFGLAIVRGDGSVVSVTPTLVHLLPCLNPKKMASQVFLLVDLSLSHTPSLPPSLHISHVSPWCVVCVCVCVCVWCRYTYSYHLQILSVPHNTKWRVGECGHFCCEVTLPSRPAMCVCGCVCVPWCMCVCVIVRACACVCGCVCVCILCVLISCILMYIGGRRRGGGSIS